MADKEIDFPAETRLVDITELNVRQIIDAADPQLRASLEELMKLLHGTDGVQLGWSSRMP